MRPGLGLPWVGVPGMLWALRFWEDGSERSSPALWQCPSPFDKCHCKGVRSDKERETRSKRSWGLFFALHQSLRGPEHDHRSHFHLLCSVHWGDPSETGWDGAPEAASTVRLGGSQEWMDPLREKVLGEPVPAQLGSGRVASPAHCPCLLPPVLLLALILYRFPISQPTSRPRPGFYISHFASLTP